MGSEFWKIAEPFLSKTAREIAYGDKSQYEVFRAVAFKVGQPLTRDNCTVCVSDALKVLRRLKFKSMPTMTNRKYILKEIALVWKGIRYERETMTDEIAAEILEKNPTWVIMFDKIPKAETPKAQKKKPTKAEDS